MSQPNSPNDEYNLYAQDFEKEKAFQAAIEQLESSPTKKEFIRVLSEFSDDFMDKNKTPGV